MTTAHRIDPDDRQAQSAAQQVVNDPQIPAGSDAQSPVASTTASEPDLAYQAKLAAETLIYKDVADINVLPEIFHYWSHTYVRPMLEGRFVPHDIVVAHEPDHLQRKFQAPDLHNAINEAFRIAQRRLAQHKDQLRDHTAVGGHEDAHEYLGQVAEITPEKDFGFLLTASGGLLYFHRNSLLNGGFDRLKIGAQVHYVEEDGDTGPLAKRVRVKS